MKTRLSIALLIAVSTLSSTASAADLIVKVTGIRDHKGTLSLAVYDSAESWDNDGKPIAGDRRTPDADEVTFRFGELLAGTYAVQAMHDANGNGKLDSNFMGMPTEGYGFSNNPKVMRKAHFDEAAVKVGDEPVTITLKLR
ncbi:MAG: DUF2141 domain-containing protein [Dokdonella sp.]